MLVLVFARSSESHFARRTLSFSKHELSSPSHRIRNRERIYHKLPFSSNFRNEDENFAISFTKQVAFAGKFLRNACSQLCLRFGG